MLEAPIIERDAESGDDGSTSEGSSTEPGDKPGAPSPSHGWER